MSLIATTRLKDWLVTGQILFDDKDGKIKPDDRVVLSATSAKVLAHSAAEAEQKFALLFTGDVRVTKVERI